MSKVKETARKMLSNPFDEYRRTYYDKDGNQTSNGEYVLTPIPQEDGSISYWIAQKGYTVAYYCFTVGHGVISFAKQQKQIKSYITMYDVRTSM